MTKTNEQLASEARERGDKTFVPKKPCYKCGTSVYYTSTRKCVRCLYEYIESIPEKRKEYSKRSYARNIDTYKVLRREQNQRDKQAGWPRQKKYREKNREKVRLSVRKHYVRNKKEINRRAVQKRQDDVQVRLYNNLQIQVYNAIKKGYKSKRTIELLGCSIEYFKGYISAQFKDGMSWSNYGEWHLDHKTPVSWYDLTDPVQQRIAFNYTNYQPLWAYENVSKGNRYSGEYNPDFESARVEP